jgi:CubicO group peptidase (beta-lactamase class C family)
MTDTGFVPSAEQLSRLVRVHQRSPDGSLEPVAMETPTEREFLSGGGGLLSTGRDYLKFLQMLLNEGRWNGAQLLRPETVALIAQNQVGDLLAGVWRTAMPERTNDLDLFPGARCRWGLASMITLDPGPNGRSAGSLTWAGLFTSQSWLGSQMRVTAVILTQILPSDRRAVRLSTGVRARRI